MSGLFGGGTGTGSVAAGSGNGSSNVPGGSGNLGLSFVNKKDTVGAPEPVKPRGLFSTHPNPPQATTTTGSSLPTDVAALQSTINTLQAELKVTTIINTHLAASVARFQVEQATSAAIATTTTTSTTAPVPCLHPDHPHTIASGRGAASPEVFKQMSKTNWHGRLGRAHMADVDALTPPTLMELDSLVRRKLQSFFPHGAMHSTNIEPDHIFACLAALGLRLEDRPRYVGFPIVGGDTIVNDSTDKRARQLTAFFYANQTLADSGYWRGALLETLLEIARYRGLFDNEGFLKEE
ncbi:uncharacterized protein H6S33_004924 [Morchella sextelata]|uniref:uncharacterized protein n=1 Tax=Morchella sextelata TaxID=1174677 RepID=UPI001D0436B3|nr:uncharacterized protein H6S33_004924 [Morchella sextelata]KAH0604942.1 hypothetical protein H6S33_004924 [Morchella sextelata]